MLYPVYRRWRVDYDYVNSLDADAKAWLAQFTDEYYGNDFGFDEPMHPEGPARRQRYSEYNPGNFDLYSFKASGGALGGLPRGELDAYHPGALGGPDLSATPQYERQEEYREALAEYRELLRKRKEWRLENNRRVRAGKDKLPADQALDDRIVLMQMCLHSIAVSEVGGTNEDI